MLTTRSWLVSRLNSSSLLTPHGVLLRNHPVGRLTSMPSVRLHSTMLRRAGSRLSEKGSLMPGFVGRTTESWTTLALCTGAVAGGSDDFTSLLPESSQGQVAYPVTLKQIGDSESDIDTEESRSEIDETSDEEVQEDTETEEGKDSKFERDAPVEPPQMNMPDGNDNDEGADEQPSKRKRSILHPYFEKHAQRIKDAQQEFEWSVRGILKFTYAIFRMDFLTFAVYLAVVVPASACLNIASEMLGYRHFRSIWQSSMGVSSLLLPALMAIRHMTLLGQYSLGLMALGLVDMTRYAMGDPKKMSLFVAMMVALLVPSTNVLVGYLRYDYYPNSFKASVPLNEDIESNSHL